MLSFEEILKRLIAHLRRRGRFENIDPNLPLSRYLSKEQTRLLIEEVRHLPWIQSGKMQLHQRAPIKAPLGQIRCAPIRKQGLRNSGFSDVAVY